MLAEALLMPISWDYYLPDGTPKDMTVRVLDILEKALLSAPLHPLALHLYVHLVEASTPGPLSDPVAAKQGAARGEGAADKLATLQSGAGHSIHMASHVYVRTGRWRDAADVNMEASRVDLDQAARCFEPYLPEHNLALLTFAASMAVSAPPSHPLMTPS
jgi:hypothetical protein